MIAYVIAADVLDEYPQVLKELVLLSLNDICREGVNKFGLDLLRAPNETNVKQIQSIIGA